MEPSEIDFMLQHLKQLLLRERACIQTLVFNGLEELQEEKKSLLNELSGCTISCNASQKQLARDLREENRRNARQIWNALNLLRRTMDDCCRRLTLDGYNHYGNRRQQTPHGLLLNGSI